MAIGTSDGQEYPSKLEEVLANLDTTGSTKAPPVPRNYAPDFQRDINEEPSPLGRTPAPPHGVEVAADQSGAGSGMNGPYLPNSGWNTLSPEEQKTFEAPSKNGGAHNFYSDDYNSVKDLHKLLDEHGLIQVINPAMNPVVDEFLKSSPPGVIRYNYKDDPSRTIFLQKKPALVGDADLPENAKPVQFLYSNAQAAESELKLTPEEKNLYDTHLRNLIGPGGVDNADGSRSSVKSMMVEFDDRTFVLPTVYGGKILDKDEAIAKAKEIGLNKFPSYDSQEEAEKRYDQLHKFMEKDTQNYQEAKGVYDKVVEQFSPSPEQQESYAKFKASVLEAKKKGDEHLAAYLETPYGKFLDTLMTGMGALGPGRGGAVTPPNIKYGGGGPKAGFSDVEFPREYHVANDNPTNVHERMKNFAEYMKTKPASGREGAPTIGEILEGLRSDGGKPSPYDQAVIDQQINSSRKATLRAIEGGRSTEGSNWTMHSEKVHNLNNAEGLEIGSAVYREHNNTWVGSRFNPETNEIIGRKSFKTLEDASAFAEGRDAENPSQQPQGRPIPGEQARTQEAQRAANDRNYRMGKDTEKVNVGQGKGVLNDNKEEVMAMIRKGHKPIDIARRFDITSTSVQNWIKRNGPITSIDDILK